MKHLHSGYSRLAVKCTSTKNTVESKDLNTKIASAAAITVTEILAIGLGTEF